jgi:ribosomal protein S11
MIKTKQQRKEFLNENWRLSTLHFKWTKSRAKETEGYLICTLKDRQGNKIASTCGGGYDMKGKVFGEMINKYFPNELKKLVANSGGVSDSPGGFYGLSHYNPKAKTHKRRWLKRATKNTKTFVDGACGFESMRRILEKIGFKIEFILEKKDSLTYTLRYE